MDYKGVPLSLTKNLSATNVLENLWLSWLNFLWWEGREAADDRLSGWLQTCDKAFEGFKEKDSVNGRSSRSDVF